MVLREIIRNIYPMPEESVSRLSGCISELHLPKGSMVLEAGKIEPGIFFINKGIVRAFINDRGKDVTFWIGKEGDTIVSLMSYVYGRPGYESVELMEDSILYKASREALGKLFMEDIGIANWGRKFAETEFMRTEQRLIPMLSMTATQRYTRLLEDNPELLQRLPLECLASYLGITPVSLSRIRAGIGK